MHGKLSGSGAMADDLAMLPEPAKRAKSGSGKSLKSKNSKKDVEAPDQEPPLPDSKRHKSTVERKHELLKTVQSQGGQKAVRCSFVVCGYNSHMADPCSPTLPSGQTNFIKWAKEMPTDYLTTALEDRPSTGQRAHGTNLVSNGICVRLNTNILSLRCCDRICTQVYQKDTQIANTLPSC